VPKKPPSWRCVKRAVATVTLVAVLVYCFTARRSSAPLGAWYGSAAKLGGLGKIVNDRKLNKSDLETLKRKEKVILDSVVAEKTILYWYEPWGERSEDEKLPAECGSCTVTQNRKKIDSDGLAAVVFHVIELRKGTMPSFRNPKHYYVFNSMESPAFTIQFLGKRLLEFDGVFNLTMTHRRDSDVYQPYNTVAKVLGELQGKFKDTDDVGVSSNTKRKKYNALWIVSNCHLTKGSVRRLKIVEKMVAAGIDIDRRGGCFPNNPKPPLGRNSQVTGSLMHEFIADYRFYLSFENSHHCRDYITEKFFISGLLAGAVPLVWGATRGDYEAILPPNSFIFVDDFISFGHLREYLDYLSKNESAYAEYFQWRRSDASEVFGHDVHTGACRLCRVVHGIEFEGDNSVSSTDDGLMSASLPASRTIASVDRWWYEEENEECFT